MEKPNNNTESSWTEWRMYVLKELESLNDETEDLYKKLEEHNASKEVLELIKAWKLKVESIATFDDLRNMKKNVSEFKTFRTQIITAVVVIQTVFTAAIAIMEYIHWSK